MVTYARCLVVCGYAWVCAVIWGSMQTSINLPESVPDWENVFPYESHLRASFFGKKYLENFKITETIPQKMMRKFNMSYCNLNECVSSSFQLESHLWSFFIIVNWIQVCYQMPRFSKWQFTWVTFVIFSSITSSKFG